MATMHNSTVPRHPATDHIRDASLMLLCCRVGRPFQVDWLDVQDGARLLEQDAALPDILREQAA